MRRSQLLRLLLFSGALAGLVLVKNLVVLWYLEKPEPDLDAVQRLLVVLTAVMIAAVFLAGYLYFRTVSKRLGRVLRGLEEVREGKYPHLLVEGTDEFTELARGFNQMVEELRARDDKLKDWAGHRETELVRLSQTLEAEREKLGTVLESIGDGVIVLDSESKVLMANRRVSEIFGVPMEALQQADLGKLIEQIRHRLRSPELIEQKVRELQRDPNLADEITLELDEPTGQILRLYSAPVRGADGKVIGRIATSLDLGKERELEHLKSEFLSTISHELRTPLTSIKGALGLIRGGVAGFLSADMKELLDIALTNTDRLIGVINNILDVFQLERGQALIRPVSMSLPQSVARATMSVASLAEARQIRIETQFPPKLPAVQADPKRVEQVLVNLLSNAIKFSLPGQRVVVTARAEDGEVVTSVQDFGRGMSREFQERLFTKFEHAEASLTRDSQGAGLGLAICRHILHAHGGRIWVESQEGRGATFHFTLRAVDGQGETRLLGGRVEEPQLHVPRLVLVIDDDEDVTRVISYVFETMGHRVLCGRTGREAIELARKHRPDMLTLDLLMPDMDGYAVIEALRAVEETRHIPIICISVVANAEKAIAHGADYCLEKPIDIDKLREVATRALAAAS